MDIERLRTDPAYWDEVAPEGATHYNPTGSRVRWYYQGPARWEYFSPSHGDWRPSKNVGAFFNRLVPRPSQPQWRGPEDGLPPVGTVCEYQSDAWSWQAGDRVEVLAHRSGKVGSVAVVWNLRAKQARGVIAGVLRPLRSDKERAVEAVLKATPCPTLPRTVEAVVGDLYDAGFLRLPEEQS